MSETSDVNENVKIINPPQSSVTDLIGNLLSIHKQGEEYRIGDDQVLGVGGGGKNKKYKIRGGNRTLVVKAKNMEEAASIGFLKINGGKKNNNEIFKVNNKLFQGIRRNTKGKKYKNIIQEL